MKITRSKFLKACLNKRRKMEHRTPVTPSSTSSSPSACEGCCQWGLWPLSPQEERFIPGDVPKGHLAVYVGKNCRRFVIRIALLDHPLFQALLDLARDEYGFTSGSKLCIPCDENMFIEVVRCAGSERNQRDFLCI